MYHFYQRPDSNNEVLSPDRNISFLVRYAHLDDRGRKLQKLIVNVADNPLSLIYGPLSGLCESNAAGAFEQYLEELIYKLLGLESSNFQVPARMMKANLTLR